MIKYSIPKKVNYQKIDNYDNRGILFEDAINATNQYYLDHDIAVIYKKPTPIHVVKIDNSLNRAKITEAFFEQPSTTDYNGIYKGRYLDFEAKETKNKTSFPLKNIYSHQVDHLKRITNHGGIAFVLIRFTTINEIYLIDAAYIHSYYYKDDKRSISYDEVVKIGVRVKEGYLAQIDYLEAVNKTYFK